MAINDFNKRFTYGKSPDELMKETGSKLLSYQPTVAQPATAQGQVGQSFDKMMGGGGWGNMQIGGMNLGMLEAASMRMADAAAARESKAAAGKLTTEREFAEIDRKRAESQSNISKYEDELSRLRSISPRNNAEQAALNQAISDTQGKISREKSNLSNLDAKEKYAAANARMRG